MNLGKFVGSAAVSAIKEWNPRGPDAILRRAENKAFRRAFKKARKGETLTQQEIDIVTSKTATVTLPDGTVIQRAEPTLPGRTSTKVAVSGFALGLPIIQTIQGIEFPWPWVETFTNSDVFVQVATLALAWFVARISTSPAQPGVL